MKHTKYSELTLAQLKLQIERLQPSFKYGTMTMEQQGNYLIMKRELFNRRQGAIDLNNTNQLTLI